MNKTEQWIRNMAKESGYIKGDPVYKNLVGKIDAVKQGDFLEDVGKDAETRNAMVDCISLFMQFDLQLDPPMLKAIYDYCDEHDLDKMEELQALLETQFALLAMEREGIRAGVYSACAAYMVYHYGPDAAKYLFDAWPKYRTLY